jgi:hypothetical protein
VGFQEYQVRQARLDQQLALKRAAIIQGYQRSS